MAGLLDYLFGTETHKHRCGYGWNKDPHGDPVGAFRYLGDGCGVVFEHDGGSHTCTRCGVRTLWKYYGPIRPGNGLRRDLRPSNLHGPWPKEPQRDLFPTTC